MTNAEFYKDEIKNYKGDDFCCDFKMPRLFERNRCEDITCSQCDALFIAWMMEEHKEPEVDWKNIPVDTPVLVRLQEDGMWEKRYFAEFDNSYDAVMVWDGGRTSFTSCEGDKLRWKYAKLWEGSEEQAAEKEKQNDEN